MADSAAAEAYRKLESVRANLVSAGMVDDVALVEDVMDQLWGYCNPRLALVDLKHV